MARGRGRPSKRGRGRPPTSLRNEAAPSTSRSADGGTMAPPIKKRRSGRPSKADLEEQRLQEEEEARIQTELQQQLEALQQQVMEEEDEGQSSNEAPFVAAPKKKTGGRPCKREIDMESADEMTVQLPVMDEEQSCGLHMTTMQIKALANLVACKDCGESVTLSIRPTTKGMISEFVVGCTVCEAKKVTITPNLVRERKRKREVKGLVLQKTENINYAHVAAFLDNGLGYSGLRHYCKYFNARCLNEATFIVYARQVIQDVVNDTEDNLQSNARIVRKVYDAGLDEILDITVSFTTTYHQWGSDFCLVAGAVIELQTGLVLDYDVANMYCHVCKINAKRIISMTPTEMTDWFNKHQTSCEIREWCDELDHDAEEGVKDIEPKYLECFVAKKIWSRSAEKFGFRYSTLIHESDETIHNELLRSAPYGDTLVMIDNLTNCFSRRKSEHARTAFQNKLKSKCPRERVQTKDRIMYVYAMSIPEYNRFAVGSNIKLRELVRRMEIEEAETEGFTLQVLDTLPTIQAHEVIPAEGEASEVVYTQVQGEEEASNEGGTEEEELYNIQREVERMEEEGVMEEDVDEEEEESAAAETIEDSDPSTSTKQQKRVKTEIKRENIVMEALEEDEECAEYELQTSVSDTMDTSSVQEGGSIATGTNSSSNNSQQQVIVVRESVSAAVVSSVSAVDTTKATNATVTVSGITKSTSSTTNTTSSSSSSSSNNNSIVTKTIITSKPGTIITKTGSVVTKSVSMGSMMSNCNVQSSKQVSNSDAETVTKNGSKDSSTSQLNSGS